MKMLLVIDYLEDNSNIKIADSIHDTGFAIIKNHDIDLKTVRNAYSEWKRHFEEYGKHLNDNYSYDPNTQDGFVNTSLSETAKGNTTKDLKQFYHYYKSGRCPESLRDVTQRMYDELERMSIDVLQILEDQLPSDIREKISLPFDDMVRCSENTLLRAIYYPILTGYEDQNAMRSAEHEDIDLITIIASPTTPGLQVKYRDGQWIDVPHDPDYVIINSGDMLSECTSGFYPSATHRVINPDVRHNMTRISIPLFVHPHSDTILSSSYTASQYKEERLRQIGLL